MFIKITTAPMMLLAFFFIVSCGQETKKTEQPLQDVTLAVSSSLLASSIFIAQKKGFFKEVGLNVTLEEYTTGSQSLAAMLAPNQKIHFSTAAPTPIMFNSFKNDSFYIFATFVFSYEDIKFLVRKDKGINSAKDLIGKKIATPMGTNGQFFTEAFLTYNGIPTDDVDVVNLPPSELPSSLERGLVDGIVIWEPYAHHAIKQMEENIIQLPSSDIYKETFNFIVDKEYAHQHPQVIEKLLTSVIKATNFINTNQQESQAIMVKHLSLDPEIAKIIWNNFNFKISLEQSLLTTLEDEARWAIQSKLITANKIPNYLSFIYSKGLLAVAPDAVGLMTKSGIE